MSEHRMLDFVRALVVAEPEMVIPSVAPVRFQVRTGNIVPPKLQMRNTNYKVLVWKYRVKSLTDFSAFLNTWETTFSDTFNQQSRTDGLLDDADPRNLIIRRSYLGTFPARSSGASAINSFNTAWGGTLDQLEMIERCRVAIPSQLQSTYENTLATDLANLFGHVLGDIEVEILDPSIGF
jgi:hypothetical protein